MSVQISPPTITTDPPHRVWWIARVHHFDGSGYQFPTWTNWFYYTPGGLAGGGGWTDTATGQTAFSLYTFLPGGVLLEQYLWSDLAQQYFAYAAWGPYCQEYPL
jgi:hypothetical protein